ncbi:hypothetical protein [Amycolatopsis sp. NPDC021455]|uniref:hypothetical protein n=1 Tax=Amycolatopsis sp. NPDC021455 TaxID=3154901 RepID=UPI0033C8D57A
MIPVASLDLTPALPSATRYWIPSDDDVTEEGIGYFRDTWLIYDINPQEASVALTEDERLVNFIDSIAQTVEEYDLISAAIEENDPERLDHLLDAGRASLVSTEINDEDDPHPLDGLEIGVAGIVSALTAAGFLTAASCRGHVGQMAWSSNPVVYVATDRRHADRVAPLVADHHCGFNIDPSRPELLVIEAPSAREMLSLARAVLDDALSFGPPVYQMSDDYRETYGY